eukprot:PhM_4_TR13893/c0_g1_i2/m.5514
MIWPASISESHAADPFSMWHRVLLCWPVEPEVKLIPSRFVDVVVQNWLLSSGGDAQSSCSSLQQGTDDLFDDGNINSNFTARPCSLHELYFSAQLFCPQNGLEQSSELHIRCCALLLQASTASSLSVCVVIPYDVMCRDVMTFFCASPLFSSRPPVKDVTSFLSRVLPSLGSNCAALRAIDALVWAPSREDTVWPFAGDDCQDVVDHIFRKRCGGLLGGAMHRLRHVTVCGYPGVRTALLPTDDADFVTVCRESVLSGTLETIVMQDCNTVDVARFLCRVLEGGDSHEEQLTCSSCSLQTLRLIRCALPTLQFLFGVRRSLRHLELASCDLDGADVGAPLRSLTSLHTLSIVDVSGDQIQGDLRDLLPSPCPGLTCLRLSGCGIHYSDSDDEDSWLGRSFPSLRRVNLDGCEDVCALGSLFSFCTQLEKFKTDCSMQSLAELSSSEPLEHLTSIETASFPFSKLSHRISPTRLTLSLLGGGDSDDVTALQRCVHRLRALTLVQCHRVQLSPLWRCMSRQLTVLKLISMPTVSDDDVADVAVYLTRLRSVHVSMCPRVTDAAPFVVNKPDLQDVAIYLEPGFRNAHAVFVPPVPRNIECIEIGWSAGAPHPSPGLSTDNNTTFEVASIVQAPDMPRLRRLRLTAPLTTLLFGFASKLTELELSNYSAGADAVAMLATNVPQLRRLSITRAHSSLTNESIQDALVEWSSTLEAVSLAMCPALCGHLDLTSACFPCLGSITLMCMEKQQGLVLSSDAMPSLKELSVTSCAMMSYLPVLPRTLESLTLDSVPWEVTRCIRSSPLRHMRLLHCLSRSSSRALGPLLCLGFIHNVSYHQLTHLAVDFTVINSSDLSALCTNLRCLAVLSGVCDDVTYTGFVRGVLLSCSSTLRDLSLSTSDLSTESFEDLFLIVLPAMATSLAKLRLNVKRLVPTQRLPQLRSVAVFDLSRMCRLGEVSMNVTVADDEWGVDVSALTLVRPKCYSLPIGFLPMSIRTVSTLINIK